MTSAAMYVQTLVHGIFTSIFKILPHVHVASLDQAENAKICNVLMYITVASKYCHLTR